MMQSTRVGSFVSLHKSPSFEPVASFHLLQQEQRWSLQQHRQCVELLPRILNSHVPEGAQTDHSFRVRLHRIQMICRARVDSVKGRSRLERPIRPLSLVSSVNLGGLPSRCASTSIVLGVDPSRSDSLSVTLTSSIHFAKKDNNLPEAQRLSQSP